MRSISGLVRLAVFSAVACASFSASPIAWAQSATSLDTMPKWAEFPVLPTDVPTAADIKKRVDAERAKQQQLNAEVSALVWDLQEPDQIRDTLLSRVDLTRAGPVDQPLTPVQLETLAAALRTRATPPPIAN